MKCLLRRRGMEEAKVCHWTQLTVRHAQLSMQMAQVVASPSEIMSDGLLRTSQLNSRCAFVST